MAKMTNEEFNKKFKNVEQLFPEENKPSPLSLEEIKKIVAKPKRNNSSLNKEEPLEAEKTSENLNKILEQEETSSNQKSIDDTKLIENIIPLNVEKEIPKDETKPLKESISKKTLNEDKTIDNVISKEDNNPVPIEKNTSEDKEKEKNPSEKKGLFATKEKVQKEKSINEKKKKQKNNDKTSIFSKKILLIFAIVLLSIVIIGMFIFYYFFGSPKTMFFRSINDLYGLASDKYDEIIDKSIYSEASDSTLLSVSNYNLTTSVSDTNNSMASTANMINGLSVNLATGIDYKNKRIAYDYNFGLNNSSLLHLSGSAVNNNIFLGLNDLYNKYIVIPFDGEFDTLFNNKKNEDVLYLTKTLKDTYLKNINSKDFTSEKSIINIGTTQYDTNKITYSLDYEKFNTLISNVKKDLLNNNDFISTLAKIASKDVSYIKKCITDYNANLVPNETITISVYIYKGKTVRYEYIDTLNEIKKTITCDVLQDYVNVSLGTNDNVLNINYTEPDGNLTKLVLTNGNNEFSINTKEENNVINYDINYKNSEGTLTATGTKVVSKEKSAKIADLKIEGSYTINSNPVVNFTLSGNKTEKIGEVINLPDTSNSVVVDEVTDDEWNSIITNFMSKEEIMKLLVSNTNQ